MITTKQSWSLGPCPKRTLRSSEFSFRPHRVIVHRVRPTATLVADQTISPSRQPYADSPRSRKFREIPSNSTKFHPRSRKNPNDFPYFLKFLRRKFQWKTFLFHVPSTRRLTFQERTVAHVFSFQLQQYPVSPADNPMKPALNYVAHFRELEVYKRQRELARAVFQISNSFPVAERYSLTDQLRRASRSIGAQIAEAWAKRLYPKRFISKLSDADAEQMETQHWLTEANDCRYLPEAEFRHLVGHCEEIGRMLGSMIQKADSFSSRDSILREDDLPYLADTDH
jgi:four helix bundle protein